MDKVRVSVVLNINTLKISKDLNAKNVDKYTYAFAYSHFVVPVGKLFYFLNLLKELASNSMVNLMVFASGLFRFVGIR